MQTLKQNLQPKYLLYNQTCAQWPPWDSRKLSVLQKWLLFRGWFLRFTTNIKKLGITLAGQKLVAVVNRWLLAQV